MADQRTLVSRALTARPLILAYHGIGRLPREQDPLNLMVPADNFTAQVRRLKRSGYDFVTTREFAERLTAGASLARVCALTFDDGSKDSFSVLPNLLEQLSVPATVYLCPGLLGRPHPFLAPSAGIRLMDLEEVRELSRNPQIELGSHTNTHEDLSAASEAEAYAEMSSSRERLEDLIELPVASFAYPYCRYSPACLAAARRARYTSAVTCAGRGAWSPYELRRESIDSLDREFTFALKRAGIYYPVRRSAGGRIIRWAARSWRHPS